MQNCLRLVEVFSVDIKALVLFYIYRLLQKYRRIFELFGLHHRLSALNIFFGFTEYIDYDWAKYLFELAGS